MTNRLSIAVTAALMTMTMAIGTYARELQTVCSVGRYRVKTPADIARSAQDMAALSPDTRAALTRTIASARQFLYQPPLLAPLNVAYEKACANNRLNANTAQLTLDFALAYTLTGDRRYRDKAVANFQAFINTFPALTITAIIDKEHKSHVLYARDWLPDLSRAYDILFDSLAPNEEAAIRTWLKDMVRLFERKAMWEKWRFKIDGSWHAAALGIVASATCDPRLKLIAEERMRFLAANVVGSDGVLPGGSLDAQYTIIRAFLAYSEATMSHKDNAYNWRNKKGEQYIRKMLDAPLMFVDPYGVVPGNDQLAAATPPADMYLIGSLRYKDTLYGAYSMRSSTNLPSWQLLLYGDTHGRLPHLESRPVYSAVSPNMGWAVLRTGGSSPAQELYARLDYGPHGGMDGHADKLALYIGGFGKRVTADNDLYSSKSPFKSEWARETLAHNTVVINYRSQLGTDPFADAKAAEGTLLMFDRTPTVSIVEADARAAYPIASLSGYRRCVATTDRYVIDVFNVCATRPVTADWLFHGLGKYITVENAAPGDRSLNNEMVEQSILGTASNGYRWIDDITTFSANEQWSVTWDCGLRTIMMGQPGTQLLVGKSGGNATFEGDMVQARSYTQNTVIARRQNVIDTRFVALHEIVPGKKPNVLSFARLDTGNETLVLEVIMPDYKDILILQPKKAVQDLVIDDKHRVTTESRRYAFVRFSRPGGKVVDSVNLTVSAPF